MNVFWITLKILENSQIPSETNPQVLTAHTWKFVDPGGSKNAQKLIFSNYLENDSTA